MDDAALVRAVERVGHLNSEIDDIVGLERRAREAIAQGLPLQQLHHDEGLAFVLADIVNRADVGVIEAGRGPRFADQPLDRLAIPGQLFRNELEGDRAAKADVLA